MGGRRAAALAAACLAGSVVAAQLLTGSTGAQAPERPNIVFLLTDDQTAEQMRVMPLTKSRIGGHGVTFKRSYVSYPLCCPARATQLTGQFAHNNGVRQNGGPNGGYDELKGDHTVAVALQGAGYRTVHIGKYLNGYGGPPKGGKDVPPGWDEWHGAIARNGQASAESLYYNYYLNNNGTVSFYGAKSDHYKTDVVRHKAVKTIRRLVDERPDQPFFINVSLPAPHWPWHKAPRHRDRYRNAALPRPPSFNEPSMRDKSNWLRAATHRLTSRNIDVITRSYRKRLGTLVTADDAVDRIVAALRAEGVLDNTYVIFASDNGFFIGEHRIPDGKYLPYEPSSRVPLMIRGPGIPENRSTTEFVSNVDWTPTMLDAADAAPVVTQDGRSLLPHAENPSLRTDRALLLESTRFGSGRCESAEQASVSDLNQDGTTLPEAGGPDATASGISIRTYHAIRVPGYMLVEYSNCERELYDISKDPHQLHAKGGTGRYRPVRDALLAELRRLSLCVGEDCNQEMAPLPDPD